MHFAGVVPEAAPDPRIEARERLRSLPFPVFGLVDQPSIELLDAPFVAGGGEPFDVGDLSISSTYVLWRNPDDRSDPVNLRELDDLARAALEEDPPWPRPPWLLDMVERARYPWLWECVRTRWSRVPPEEPLSWLLAHHANHILMNCFRAELSLEPAPVFDGPWMVTERAADPHATIEVDGIERPALRIDTDPLVYAIGTRISPEVVVTVVLPREALPLVRVALQTQHSPLGV